MVASVWNEEEGCEEVREVHGWVRRWQVHGSDYKEASRCVRECDGLGGNTLLALCSVRER